LGIEPSVGGLTKDLAGIPLSSHHFLLSELAGGSPGSIASYPIRSSSSDSKSSPFVTGWPTEARRS
jgi:hypothetical protein